MKDQYVIKLGDNHTTMNALEDIFNDVQAEVYEKRCLQNECEVLYHTHDLRHAGR